MPLGSGSTFGPYEIEAPLGAGAMGEVFRARDSRLGRQVALKVLQPQLTADPDALVRFEREARALAALQHPHVASIYGVEESGPTRALVMELVDGETLATRLSRGAIPWSDALRLAVQIASALEAAHERGLVHRDLKPANIQVMRNGTVKVLDFGLARLLDSAGSSSGTQNPTMTAVHTQAGTILGTAAYMSPEQARGEAADARSDIWALGCILYEMLCARRPFGGSTAVESLAAILEREPDWTRVPQSTPASVRKLLQRCLRKNPMQRLQHAGDVRLEIDDVLSGAMEPVGSRGSTVWRMSALVATAVAVVLLGVLARNFRTPRRVEPAPAAASMRASIELPPDLRLSVGGLSILAISPDSKTLVFSAVQEGHRRLYRRKLDEFRAEPIPDSDDGAGPFFSPDGNWIGFFANGYMKKVAATGGGAINITPAPSSRGAAWLEDNTIVFTPEPDVGLSRVSADGGSAKELTTTDAQANEIAHRWPHALPGGDAFLFTTNKGVESDSLINIFDLRKRQSKRLIPGTSPYFVPDLTTPEHGEIVYVREAQMFAVAFDLRRLEIDGTPHLLETGATAQQTSTGPTALAVSRTGTVVYATSDPAAATNDGLVWVDRRGREQLIPALRGRGTFPRLSSDGRRVLLTKLDAGNYDIWAYDFVTTQWNRLTFDSTFDAAAVWSPDNTRIAFRSFRGQPFNIFCKPSEPSGAEQRITNAKINQVPHAWTQKGNIVYTEIVSSGGRNMSVVSVEGNHRTSTLLSGLNGPVVGAPSPNGKWLAYTTAESSVPEVFVLPFDGEAIASSAKPIQISLGGGIEPVWSRDGRELFYRGVDHMMAARPQSGKPPEALFSDPYMRWGEFVNYAVAPDGRFLMVTRPPVSPSLKVVTNILATLNKS